MEQAAEVLREELLAEVRKAGVRLTRAQLLRWQDTGVLPAPRRKGKGRGRGTVFLYPAYAVPLAAVIAHALKERRNLDHAAWAAWVLGFPLTGYVRELLLEILRLSQRDYEVEYRRLKRGDRRSAIAHIGRGERPRGLKPMRKVLRAESLAKVLRIITEQQLGVLKTAEYTDDDWLHMQDAFVAQFMPELHDHLVLPAPAEVRAGYQQLSDRQSLSQVIVALQKAPRAHLEIIRNEAQVLAEMSDQAIGANRRLIDSDTFLHYFAVRYVNPPPEQDLVQLFKALGWQRPPEPPLLRWRTSPPSGSARSRPPNSRGAIQ